MIRSEGLATMTVNLSKGGNVSLTKLASDNGLTLGESAIACGWDANIGGRSFDLDLVAVATDASKEPPNSDWFVYYGNKKAPKRVIVHSGDNLTGHGDGDDETIMCDFKKIPDEIQHIFFAVNVYSGQTFGNVENAFVRVYDKRSGQEFTRYNLGADFTDETLVIFGELYRHSGDWKFRAIGEGYSQEKFRQEYGISRKF